MYCNNCGKEINNEWKACPYCGARNENVLTESTPQPTPQMNYGQPTPQAPYGQPVPQPSYNQQYGQPLDFNRDFINPAQPKPKKKVNLPIIITAVVLVAAIVLGAIFIPGLLKSKGEEGENSGGGEPVKNTETVWIMTSCEDANGNGFELEYDSENNIKKILFINDESGYEYTYDTEGNLTEKTFWFYDYDEISNRHVYDKEGKETEYFEYKYGEERTHTVCEYDANGRLVKETEYRKDGYEASSSYEYYSHTVFEYDSNGYCIKETETSVYGNVWVTENTYDSNGRLTEIRDYDSDGELWHIEKYKYNHNGHIVEFIYEWYSDLDSKNIQTYQYEYDENGNIAKVTTYENSEFVCELVMEYRAVEVPNGKADNYNGQQEEIVYYIVGTSASIYNQVVC